MTQDLYVATRTMTQGEIERNANDLELYLSMRRRIDAMEKALSDLGLWGRNRNTGVMAAMRNALHEISDRTLVAFAGSVRDETDFPGAVGGAGIGVTMARAELRAYYGILRAMYESFAAYRLIEPSDVTEATREGELADGRKRDRNNPPLVYAHDPDCTVDHTPNGPKSRRKNCPTPEEWDA
jgi:hypothetical protein